MNLEVTGYQTVSYLDGNDASEGIAWDHEFQCALVDIMLPGKDGYTLLPELNHYGIPVIFLTARADIASKVKGLKEGAEDYIVKPFEMLEVMVRLEKVLERHGNLQEQIQINNITIDTISHTVTRHGEEIYLKPMEYNCLMMFVRNPNKALTREQLLAGLWGVEFEGETRTVDAHVGRIRKKLGWQEHIKTVYKVGYLLESKPFPALDTDWRWNFEAFYKNLFTGGLRDPDFILRCFFLYFISLEESEYSVYQ